jgi:hypothetical protein
LAVRDRGSSFATALSLGHVRRRDPGHKLGKTGFVGSKEVTKKYSVCQLDSQANKGAPEDTNAERSNIGLEDKEGPTKEIVPSGANWAGYMARCAHSILEVLKQTKCYQKACSMRLG